MDPAATESSCGQEPSRRQTASRLLLRMPPQLCRCHFNTGAFCSLVSFAVWHLSSFHLILIQPTKRGFLNPQICSEGAVRAVKHCPDLSRTQECTFHRSEIKAVTAGLLHAIQTISHLFQQRPFFPAFYCWKQVGRALVLHICSSVGLLHFCNISISAETPEFDI